MNLEGRTSVLSVGGGGLDESVEHDDIALVRRCQKGDALAFEQLVIKYRSKVFSMIYGMVQNEQDAWDLAQEGFVKAWRSIHRFKGQASFYTWLYRIVTNVAIDSLRRKSFKKTAEFDDEIAATQVEPGSKTMPQPDPMPHQGLEREEIRHRIEHAINKLSPEHRAVIVMKEIEELQYNEIAEALGCSIGTVMSRLFYARKKLQTLLKDVYENL
ncbi:MAG TPA: sigma-70 family RNA polymerase sigma factor [Chthoniobacterales bacterium]|jgi:RNA polymerase sigma-70 factor, ECF subfamily|nr:sigma-70 family RNA polymerase sigma factor [Chthoniobacterales bacterium]